VKSLYQVELSDKEKDSLAYFISDEWGMDINWVSEQIDRLVSDIRKRKLTEGRAINLAPAITDSMEVDLNEILEWLKSHWHLLIDIEEDSCELMKRAYQTAISKIAETVIGYLKIKRGIQRKETRKF